MVDVVLVPEQVMAIDEVSVCVPDVLVEVTQVALYCPSCQICCVEAPVLMTVALAWIAAAVVAPGETASAVAVPN